MRWRNEALLKADRFGQVQRVLLLDAGAGPTPAVRRDLRASARLTRPLARWLARREARALTALEGVPGVPRLLEAGRDGLLRSWIEGRPMQQARPRQAAYYRSARRLLCRLHRAGVTHDDLAKEPNWLVTPDGSAALVDFQLARVAPRRGALFRLLAREDLRHLIKHKATYRPQGLTAREQALLAHPSRPARWLRRWAKPAYNLLTRRLLKRPDREGSPPSPGTDS